MKAEAEPAVLERATENPDQAGHIGNPTQLNPAAKLSVRWPPASVAVLPETALRASLPLAASCAALSYLLPRLPPEFASATPSGLAASAFVTMAGVTALVVAVWRGYGTEMHPITAKARGVEPPPAVTFNALGLSGPVIASAALAVGYVQLPVAFSPLELLHCALPFALWQADVRLLRWLNPHVRWPDEAVSLVTNYREEHGANPVGAALALLGVFMFEVYVQQMIGADLALSGWPLLGTAALVALSAGLLNHAMANGVLNGLLCMEFYWTVSLMFGLSNSALPVGIYHHLMYSMPTFVAAYDDAVEASPSPVAHTFLLHATLMAWHAALFAALALVGVPTAMELHPASTSALGLLPSSLTEGFGLLCLALFGAAATSVAVEAAKAGRDPRAV